MTLEQINNKFTNHNDHVSLYTYMLRRVFNILVDDFATCTSCGEPFAQYTNKRSHVPKPDLHKSIHDLLSNRSDRLLCVCSTSSCSATSYFGHKYEQVRRGVHLFGGWGSVGIQAALLKSLKYTRLQGLARRSKSANQTTTKLHHLKIRWILVVCQDSNLLNVLLERMHNKFQIPPSSCHR